MTSYFGFLLQLTHCFQSKLKTPFSLIFLLIWGLCLSITSVGCTQEGQNHFSRSLQNWTGTNGILEIYAGDKLVAAYGSPPILK